MHNTTAPFKEKLADILSGISHVAFLWHICFMLILPTVFKIKKDKSPSRENALLHIHTCIYTYSKL